MNRKKEPLVLKPATADDQCIRVRLDHKTVVLLKSMDSFASWKQRYPAAQLVEVVPARGKVRRDTGKE
jgi:hypothetical protein